MNDAKIIKNNLPKVREIVNKSMNEAMRQGGQYCLSVAKKNIVEKNIIDTGFMLNSGYVRYGGEIEASRNSYQGYKLPLTASLSQDVEVGFAALYAKYHEFGTIYMAARPFLTPALLDTQQKMPEIIKRRLRANGM